ncbi:MAG: ABC transporter ATP-binding protein, partial [Methanomassiliicoccales archaeon]|nr:ABC transporter ATP-binding protein [Methanomassiliicoccales archaeon]
RGLSKSYIIGHRGGPGSYKRLSEVIVDSVAHPIRTAREIRSKKEVFWALKDVSFSVEKGEVVGLIGKNGAGKTTILKIVSRITYPTSGEIILRGRVGSLLEVGTGFHPELTGAENIYMNGAILGMKKTEIDSNFEEIVKFSEMEKFLDTPVKRYSSGMYVRLAFAVAAHLQPEILLVDEVLAVGDAQFQKKCLGKIRDVSRGGRTVLFVSHNMPVVEGLCERALLIDDGQLKMAGDSHDVVAEYLRMLSLFKGSNLEDPAIKRGGNGKARFSWIEILDEKDEPMDSVPEGRPFKISLRLKVSSSVDLDGIGVTFIDKMGRSVLTTMHSDSLSVTRLDRGSHRFSVLIDPNPFVRGSFSLKLYCRGPNFQEYDTIDYAYNVIVTPNLDSQGVLGKRAGTVRIPFEWSSEGWES